jgi:NAD-dependent dihydropyrimidine dehydrogenase PreA subunit
MVEIQVDVEKCTGCGTCVDVCPVGVYELQNEKSVPVNIEDCLICRACEMECPEGAIQVIEE